MRWCNLSIVALVVAALPALGIAQVVQNNIGQSLDANYQIGSGGYNSVNGGMGGVNSQLIVNGQVSGLAYFHGRVPIEASDQLRMPVPSAALGDFVRTSVGLPQVLTGSGYHSVAYYNPGTTAFGVRGIMGGLTPPGSNTAIGQIIAVAINRIYSEVTEAYQPLVTAGAGAPSPIAYETTIPGTQVNIVSRPGSIALFGVPQYAQGTEVAMEIRRFLQNDGRGNPSSGVPAAPIESMDNTIWQPGQNLPDNGLQIGGQQTLGSTNVRDIAGSTPGGKPGALGPSNQDAYLDLLTSLQKQMREEKEQKAPLVAPGKLPEEVYPPGAPKHGQKNTSTNPSENPSDRVEQPLVERDKAGIIIHGLAGRSADLFNRYMNRAKRLMADRKYFDAAKDYELAEIADSNNPMAYLGATVAYFTAGEPYSAAIQLRKAMGLLPPLMETRVDIDSMVNPEDFQAQLTAMDHRLANAGATPEPMLLFVAAFMHRNAGKLDSARADAKRLLDAKGDPIFQAYANYLLTGQRPTTHPTTKK